MAKKTQKQTGQTASTAHTHAKASPSKSDGGKARQRERAAAADEIAAGVVAKKGKRASTGSAGVSSPRSIRRATKGAEKGSASPPKPLLRGALVSVDGEVFFDTGFTGTLPESGFLPALPGRPTLYREEYCGLVIKLARNGLGQYAIARRIGVTRQTLYNWAREHASFADALKRAHTAMVGHSEERLALMISNGGRPGQAITTMFALRSIAPEDWSPPRAPTFEEVDGRQLAALPVPEPQPQPMVMTEADLAEIRSRLAKGLMPDLPYGLRVVPADEVDRSAFEEIGRRIMTRRMLEDDDGADANRDASPEELREIEEDIAREKAEKAALAAMPPATDSVTRAMQLIAAKRGKVLDPAAFDKRPAAAPEPEPEPLAAAEDKPLEGQILPPPGRRFIDL